jgi:hypothetical protein
VSAASIFISYRTADGVDKATALARELNAVFGHAQVFLDKEDLPAGLPWRDAVGHTLDAKPVLLLVVTPQTFGARIADPQDPVRREIEAALGFGAHVIPLLADGVEQLPDAATLPESLRSLGERTWRRLRAYDWAEDLARLVGDLRALGLRPLVPARRRWLELSGAFAAGALLGGGGLALSGTWGPWGRLGTSATEGLNGPWRLTAAPPVNEAGSRYEGLRLHLAHSGESLTLYSEPIATAADPVWKAYAEQWKQRFDQPLEHIVWRGTGRVRMEQGSPLAFDAELRVELPLGSERPIEGGRLAAQMASDGARLAGTLWMNGEQAERAVEMVRDDA